MKNVYFYCLTVLVSIVQLCKKALSIKYNAPQGTIIFFFNSKREYEKPVYNMELHTVTFVMEKIGTTWRPPVAVGLFANFDICYFFGLFVSLIACFVGCLLSVVKLLLLFWRLVLSIMFILLVRAA